MRGVSELLSAGTSRRLISPAALGDSSAKEKLRERIPVRQGADGALCFVSCDSTSSSGSSRSSLMSDSTSEASPIATAS
eukprot:CAMPEP_0185363560 /NCGR_PEP_ID=MMETSP1364-20130426/11807_1 /TAXON_ID=38817 /ORGANISM="Gephyrocapsa oceanica, Strain RCC1303" /LENGTH=78 /DNA_ID=CAMNT_0027964013 /DNA_START=140 /DNA_END=376 /DNA_ORIENTATION=+